MIPSRVGEGVLETFLVFNVFHKGPYGSGLGSNCFSRGRGSVPVFLKKTFSNLAFPRGRGWSLDPLPPHTLGPAHVTYSGTS